MLCWLVGCQSYFSVCVRARLYKNGEDCVGVRGAGAGWWWGRDGKEQQAGDRLANVLDA